MIIPVKCFTCGKVLADKWNYYIEACKRLDEESGSGSGSGSGGAKRVEIFEKLQLDRICCRRHMLGHVDMIDVI
jgi:DNA-directed RNA polymerase subunit N (RpoN/RPB10)